MERKKGFTLIELLVVIAIIALLVSILMPTLQKAKDLAKDVVCKSQQHNVALAIIMYAGTYGDQFPHNDNVPAWGDPKPDPHTNDLTWNLRVGKVPFNQIPENLRDDVANAGNVEDIIRICLEGYQDHQWYDRKSGSFKCPAYYEQVRPRPPLLWPYPETTATVKAEAGSDSNYLDPGEPTMAGDGCAFSINGQVSKWGTLSVDSDANGAWTYKGEGDGFPQTVKTTDVRGATVMAGDCNVRGGGSQLIQQPTYPTSPKYGLDTQQARSKQDRIDFAGPWMFLTMSSHGNGTPIDFYGHPNEGTNLMFADGHVQGYTTIDPAQWKAD